MLSSKPDFSASWVQFALKCRSLLMILVHSSDCDRKVIHIILLKQKGISLSMSEFCGAGL